MKKMNAGLALAGTTGFTLVGPGDITKLRIEFEEEVMPLARKVGAIDGTETFSSLLREIQVGGLGEKPKHGSARERARDQIKLIVTCLTVAQNLQRHEGSERLKSLEGNGIPDNWASVLVDARRLTARLHGYLSGIDDEPPRTQRAAQSRIKLGETTKDRLRDAVSHLAEEKITKSAAAEIVSKKIALSYGRTLKLMSEIWPGDAWPKS